jgi:hypothetical protein
MMSTDRRYPKGSAAMLIEFYLDGVATRAAMIPVADSEAIEKKFR